MIQSDEFIGMKCRILSFLIAKDATFSILIGRSTIFKLELMVRRKRETDGEGVHVGILGDVSKGMLQSFYPSRTCPILTCTFHRRKGSYQEEQGTPEEDQARKGKTTRGKVGRGESNKAEE